MVESENLILGGAERPKAVALHAHRRYGYVRLVAVEHALCQPIVLHAVETLAEICQLLVEPLRQLPLRKHAWIDHKHLGITALTLQGHESAQRSAHYNLRLLLLDKLIDDSERAHRVGIQLRSNHTIATLEPLLQLPLLRPIGSRHKPVKIHHHRQRVILVYIFIMITHYHSY